MYSLRLRWREREREMYMPYICIYTKDCEGRGAQHPCVDIYNGNLRLVTVFAIIVGCWLLQKRCPITYTIMHANSAAPDLIISQRPQCW